MSQLTYPSGRILAITRNSVGQVTGVTMKKNATAAVENVATALAFQPLSDQLSTLTHGNGLVSNALYDLDGRLTQLQVKDGTTLVSGFGLAYADNLNLTGITDQVTAANSNVLAYTPANRLASASGVWGNKAYSYDGVGNRISDVTTGGTSVSRTQYYSNTSNRLNDIWENGAQLRVYTYDGAGNTLTETRPGEAFAYTGLSGILCTAKLASSACCFSFLACMVRGTFVGTDVGVGFDVSGMPDVGCGG